MNGVAVAVAVTTARTTSCRLMVVCPRSSCSTIHSPLVSRRATTRSRPCWNQGGGSSYSYRFKSTSSIADNIGDTFFNNNNAFSFDENGDAPSEVVKFPTSTTPSSNSDDAVEEQPILLNAKEHAVGYLSRILNARVYEAAVETELQHAKNLSAVRGKIRFFTLQMAYLSTHLSSFFCFVHL